MKKDNKSVLSMKQIIIVLPILIMLTTLMQHLSLRDKNISLNAKEEEKTITQEENTIQELEIAENYERKIATTSRSQETRILNNENVEQHEQQEEKVEEKIEEAIQYKSIDEIKISKKMDLTKRCGISQEDFKILIGNVKQDTSKFFYDNSDYIYNLCEEYELNEIFFCGLIAGESGWSIGKEHRKKCNYISMMSNGKMIKYNSCEEGLTAAAKLLHNKYLTKGGDYYLGKTLSSVKVNFCPVSGWVDLVYGCMEQIVK